MSDPLGLIGRAGATPPPGVGPRPGSRPDAEGPSFKELLSKQIAEVNQLQRDADAAIEDFAAGRTDDLEGVLLASQKADTAVKMLLQVRNRVMDAYEEVKQIRV